MSAMDLKKVHPEKPAPKKRRAVKLKGDLNRIATTVFDCERSKMPGGIDLDELVLGVRFAALAYASDENPFNCVGVGMAAGGNTAFDCEWKLTKILTYLGYTIDCVFSCGAATEGYIAHIDTDIIVAYRGSDEAFDWVANARMSQTEFKPKKDKGESACRRCFTKCCCVARCQGKPMCHSGFYDAFMASVPDIDEHLIPKLSSTVPKRIFVTGHSLGGALATAAFVYLLQSVDLKSLPHRIVYVTAGQPRFGDHRFCAVTRKLQKELEKLNKCSVARLVNDHDPVPTTPALWQNYEHARRICLLTDEGELLIGPETEDANDVDLTEMSFGEHYPERYLELLKQQVVKQRQQMPKRSEGLPSSPADEGLPSSPAVEAPPEPPVLE